jgi:glutaredoxin-like protein
MVVEMDDETRAQVEEMFTTLDSNVKIHLFIADHDCLYCNDTQDMAEMIAEISDKVDVVVHKGSLDEPEAKRLGIERTPAMVLHGKEEYKVKFYGIPAGHEFGALIGSIIDVSTGVTPLAPDIVEDIQSIDKPIKIRVFVTPQCPYCPNMTRLAHQAAILNPLISSEMIESLEFGEVAQEFEVFGVPKTVFNDSVSAEGLTPPDMFGQ